MYISYLKTRNYKNLKNNIFKFDKNINTIIGENGTGKTNIFQALRFVLDKSNRMYLSEETFSNSLDNIKGHWILITVKFSGIGKSVEEVFLKPNEESESNFSLIFKPKKQIRSQLHKLSSAAHDETDINKKQKKFDFLKEYINQIDIRDDYETIKTVTTIFDINNDEMYKSIVGDFDLLKFPDPEIQDDKAIIGNIDQGFSNYINVTFIPAIRDVTGELTNENNFLSRILKHISNKVDNDEWIKFESSISTVNEELGQIKAFTEFIQEVGDTTNVTVGDIYSSDVELQMEMPNKRANIVKYFSLKGREEDNSLGLYNRSLGDNNIIYFALKLVESSMSFGHSNKVFKLMLIEEPEAHIHKFLQESLFNGIRKNNLDYQLMLSTHSVHISESSKISSMTILDKKNKTIVAYKPNNKLDKTSIEYLERYLDATKIPILFSKSSIVVEGTAELILIPKLYSLLYNFELSKVGISLISVDCSYFTGISRLFHEERIQKFISVITDQDKDYDQTMLNKEEKAKKRIAELFKVNKNNKYVNISHSEYTFEIDFYRENIKLLKQFAKDNKIYKNEKLLNELDSMDITVCFSRIMKICDNMGKGWLAFKFGKWLEEDQKYVNELKIPNYIHEATSFLIKNYLSDRQLLNLIESVEKNRKKNCNIRDEFKSYLEAL